MTSGPVLFAHFAYPPNVLGYCGPEDHRALLEYGATGEEDGGLRKLARGFEGAWPYLELIAAANRIADPLDARVVEAYWIGNRLLDRVSPALLGPSLEARFRGPAGRGWEHLADLVALGARPHHAFHVFGVYPWVGLLRSGIVDQPLHVLDRCRVRWGRVIACSAGRAVVRARPLVWDGRALTLGAPRIETAIAAEDGTGFVADLAPGDWVALHWDWVCERLSPGQLGALRRSTADQLALVNGASHPAPAAVLA